MHIHTYIYTCMHRCTRALTHTDICTDINAHSYIMTDVHTQEEICGKALRFRVTFKCINTEIW